MKIENVGFANLINGKMVSAVLQGEKNIYEIMTDINATKWNSTEITNLQKEVQLPEDIELGAYKVFLRISRYGAYRSDNNYQCIQFDKDKIWNEEFKANENGNIMVVETSSEEEVVKAGKGKIVRITIMTTDGSNHKKTIRIRTK